MRRCWGWIATRSFTPNREAPAPLGSSSGLPAACRRCLVADAGLPAWAWSPGQPLSTRRLVWSPSSVPRVNASVR